MNINPRLIPTLMIGLQVLSAGCYAANDLHDWRKIVYWLSAATLTYAVTY